MAKSPKTLIERFEEKYFKEPNSGCWLWEAAYHKDGYGWFVTKTSCLAHRWSYAYYKGEIPEGLLVCHTCDTPACVNPDHLFLGTDKDNAMDRAKKGRSARHFGDSNGNRIKVENRPYGDKNGSRTHPEVRPRGENQHKAKLTNEQVILIFKSPLEQKELAKIYGVCQTTISHIKCKTTWKHITKDL